MRLWLSWTQTLYAKACEDAWKHKDLYAEVLLRLGTFHTILNLLSIISKRFQDAGLRDICTESGIIAEGSVSGVLERDVQLCGSTSEVHLRGPTAGHLETVHCLETNNYSNKLMHLRAIHSEVEEMAETFSNRSAITSWTASPCCRCTSCGVNTWSISATRIASYPPFECPTSTLLGMCC